MILAPNKRYIVPLFYVLYQVSTELSDSNSLVEILKVQLAEVNDLKISAQTQLDEKDTLIQVICAQRKRNASSTSARLEARSGRW